MSDDNNFGQIVALLEARYVEAQKVADEKLSALNAVRQEAGLPPRNPGVEGSSESGNVPTQIKRDTFYGKKQMTAIREFLEMRRAQGDGPATPREVLDSLKAGGYRFETKSDDIALVGVRALLRKANNVFHKLPGTGSYGLLSWYPNAKPSREDSEPVVPKRRGRPPIKRDAAPMRRIPKRKRSSVTSNAEEETAAD